LLRRSFDDVPGYFLALLSILCGCAQGRISLKPGSDGGTPDQLAGSDLSLAAERATDLPPDPNRDGALPSEPMVAPEAPRAEPAPEPPPDVRPEVTGPEVMGPEAGPELPRLEVGPEAGPEVGREAGPEAPASPCGASCTFVCCQTQVGGAYQCKTLATDCLCNNDPMVCGGGYKCCGQGASKSCQFNC